MISKSYFPKAISITLILLIILFVFLSISNYDLEIIYWIAFLIFPLAILFLFGSLKVEFNQNGIHYKMFPFVNKKLAWNEIEKYEIVKISPLGDFLGWGFRYSSKYGWSYILDTQYAIAIQKMDGKKLALSVKDKQEVLNFLESIGK